jgi:hypothetical protein
MYVAASLTLGDDDYVRWVRERAAWPPLRPAPDPIPAERFFALFRPLRETEPLLERSWQAIRETEQVARELGARYVLVISPRYEQYDRKEGPADPERRSFPASDEYVLEPFRFFAERATTVAFPVHSLLEDFQHAGTFPLCLHNDPHWNPAGNRVAAEAIARDLLNDGVLDGCAR